MGGIGGVNLADPATALLVTCGGDTVKLFDLTEESGDPCALSYTPAPGSLVNTVKWNHTNLVVASAGEDKKISLWRKNGQSVGTLPLTDVDSGDNISESIYTINFSNKGSRYLCSGGSSHMVRIWDLQRKRCIKWLSGHTDTITGVMYNCRDEHLASVSLKGDIIVHNLASGSRATELRDPNGQALRVLDYSRLSRHILVTAGDDGSIHLWDTTGRNPKMSWQKLHSAPTSGVCCSPSNDKLIASVGLDKKLYVVESGIKRPVSCTPHESPFSSLAFRDDGFILAAGTNSGRVIFYDIRGKPQPLTILRAYNSSEAVMNLCWQRSKPVVVSEQCASEIALLGSGGEDSVLMPDPLPSLSSAAASSSASTGASLAASPARGLTSLSSQEATPFQTQRWTGSSILKLQAPRSSLNLKDDMEVFSPLVDVQPITPSLGNSWDEKEEANDKKSAFFSSSARNMDTHPISAWRSSSFSAIQEDSRSTNFSASSESSYQITHLPARRQPLSLSRFVPNNLPGSSDFPALSLKSSLIGPSFSSSELSTTSGSSSSSLSLSTSSSLSLSSFSSSLSSSLSSMLSQRCSTSVDGCPKPKPTEDGTVSLGTAEQVQGSSSFSLQLIQRTLEESLGSLQLSMHEDVMNLHIELLRQFHMQEVEVTGLMSSVMEKLDELQKEVQTLRRENQQLRMLL